jgi:type II secretory pathway pseudopilin PulG
MLTINPKSICMRRRGLSLVEIMIAMAMTLIVLGAMMAAFSYGSAEMQKGRASIDMVTRLQATENLLREDLGNVTVEVKPYHQLSSYPPGYLEIIDGPREDYNAGDYTVDPVTNSDSSFLGDDDDFIAFTVKSTGKPFRGRHAASPGGIAKSHYAEIVWFLDSTEQKLYRRVLLIRPDLATSGTVATFQSSNDISVRSGLGGAAIANTLADLGYRGNRYSHRRTTLPNTSDLLTASLVGNSSDNDVVLSNVVAFDIQVYDPDAYQYIISGPDGITDVADPSDIGAVVGVTGGTHSTFKQGAYVDLGKITGLQSGLPLGTDPSTLLNPPNIRYAGESVYDTGTSRYDNDDDNDGGNNGVDDDGDGIVDEHDEKVAVAPYNVPLRGLKITARVIEPRTKQVRQLTVKQSFVTE